MSEKVRPSYDQYVAKKGEPATVKAARAAYDAAVKKLATTPADSKEYDAAREAKRQAAVAMHDARTRAEQDYYAEEIKENTDAINEMKAENAKSAATAKK